MEDTNMKSDGSAEKFTYGCEIPVTGLDTTYIDTRTSPTVGKIGLAMSKAQVSIKGAIKDSSNPFFKSSYADLASVWDACHEAINKQELSVFQLPSSKGTEITVETLLVHSSGEWIKSVLTVVSKASDAQAVGSAITYCRRYALAAMTGVCPIDDDGEAAMGREAKTPAAKTAYKSAPVDRQKNIEDAKKACVGKSIKEVGEVADRMKNASYTNEEIHYATGLSME